MLTVSIGLVNIVHILYWTACADLNIWETMSYKKKPRQAKCSSFPFREGYDVSSEHV